MSRNDKYNKSLAEEWCIRLRTKHSDGDAYYGVVTHVTNGLIAMREEVNFKFDGVLVFPKRSIKSVRDGKFDKCCNEILRQNGQIKKIRPVRCLDACETIADVLAELQKRKIWPGVEILARDGTDEAFYIGPITAIGSKRFNILCYDAAGKWEAEYILNYDDVFRIEFDSSYCKHFNNYMKTVAPPERDTVYNRVEKVGA